MILVASSVRCCVVLLLLLLLPVLVLSGLACGQRLLTGCECVTE